MKIVITDAEGGVDEIKAAVVAEFIETQMQGLDLFSVSQVCGMLNVTPKTLDAMGVDKIDLLGNGQVIRVSLAEVKKKLAERTIKGVPTGKRQRNKRGTKAPAAA